MSNNNTVAYKLGNSLYLNVTNRCSNDCVFCIKKTNKGIGYDLTLSEEPSLQSLLNAVGDPLGYDEIVFCGYGEPLTRIELVIAASKELKRLGAKSIRINTNGQANLIHGKNVVPELAGLVDVVSISLNAQNATAYGELSQPLKVNPEEAFEAVLEFARECKKHIPRVVLSVVKWPGVDIAACGRIADDLGVDFRVREYMGNG
ncbi:TatD family nuclease-associated radical SAM protein [Desulfofalx alkaliphila]|uniref:TatD family nuclease-associated radical SAM protein n=1 Tax=Desulfofalx alkaliphila TaxID=105483 RepID=UPI0004E0B4C7|nr:TatD family nuclease-associated radical SAM protein [Desulfofalx alkaliphila]